MLKNIISISILIYFSLGTLLLPMGNFALLPQLPQMYEDCKMHEHPDMNTWEFITDHLVNVDGIFDAHDKGDEQKPHSPILNDSFFQQESFHADNFEIEITSKFVKNIGWAPVKENYKSHYLHFIFHPPIV